MITGSAFPISLHPDWLLPVNGADHSVCSNSGTPNKADVTNLGFDYVCNAGYPSWNDSILQSRPFTVDLMIPGRNYKVHGIDRNTSVLSAADCFLAQIQNTRVKITQQVLHCSNLAFCTLLLLFFFNLPFCVGVTAITKTNYNQNCMPIASLEFPILPSDMYPSAHIHRETHTLLIHSHTTTMALGQTLA